MPLFVIEGLSKSGKTTLIKKLKKRYHSSFIIYDGFSIIDIGRKDWETYTMYELKILKSLVAQNPENVFLIDRLFSEYAYGEDSDKWLRIFKQMGAHIIYLECDNDELMSRGTKDTDLTYLRERYYALLRNIPHITIDTVKYNVQKTFDIAIKYIFGE
jgi:predicted AAA+ superfamily ATPase